MADADADTSAGTGARAWFVVYLKGACMGAADTVPGVSGGTIAVIVGVYERLIAALTAVDPRATRGLLAVHTSEGRSDLAADLLRMDAPFLLVLGSGVVTAAALIAMVMNFLVTQYAAPTYAFFFGLIAASAVVLYRHADPGTPGRAAVAATGFVLAFVITGFSASAQSTDPPALLLFVAGAVAISAMVLPGISGSFLLLVMGLYEFMSGLPGAVASALVSAASGDFGALVGPLSALAAFGAGALVGVFSVAYAVRAALKRYREATLVFLVSLMLGSLRLPVVEVLEGVSVWTPATTAGVGGVALVGALAVLGLDRYTDNLDY